MWLRCVAARSLTKGQLKRRAQHAEGLHGHAALLTHQSPVHQTNFAAAADKARWPHWNDLLKDKLLDPIALLGALSTLASSAAVSLSRQLTHAPA